jgi:hypothetical protein
MAGVRFTELQSRPMAFLDFTSLTLDEFGGPVEGGQKTAGRGKCRF